MTMVRGGLRNPQCHSVLGRPLRCAERLGVALRKELCSTCVGAKGIQARQPACVLLALGPTTVRGMSTFCSGLAALYFFLLCRIKQPSSIPHPQVLCCCAARSSSAWETEKPMRRQRPCLFRHQGGEEGRRPRRGIVLDSQLAANRLQAN